MVETRDRKSAEENLIVIDTQRQRLKPPAYLNAKEKEVWLDVVNSTDPRHFKQCEAPVLAAFCTATALARFYSQRIGAEGDTGLNHKNWLDNARLMAALATRLRLTPSSRYDARAAERYSNVPDGAPPWEDA